MARPKYSKNQFIRDLRDGAISFDAQAAKEIAAIPIAKPDGRGRRPSGRTVTFVQSHHRHIFNAAYDRHITSIQSTKL